MQNCELSMPLRNPSSYESAIAPRLLSLICSQACDAQNSKKAYHVISTVPKISLNDPTKRGKRHTPYTATAPNTAVATAAPSFGSSVWPIMTGFPVYWYISYILNYSLKNCTLNIAPIVERITIAKTETTMHDHALRAETTGFMTAICSLV